MMRTIEWGLDAFVLDSRRVLVGTPGSKGAGYQNTSRIQTLRASHFDLQSMLDGPWSWGGSIARGAVNTHATVVKADGAIAVPAR